MLRCNINSCCRLFATSKEVGETSLFNAQKPDIGSMREFKKYPNRRLYDIEESKYVTVEDIRKLILKGESISVVDSKTEKDLTRTVLMQIISEQEGEGHEPILTNRVLEQLVRFYGDALQSVVGRYIEQSIMTFLEHQDRYRQNVRDLSGAEPLNMMRKAMEQNMDFWNRVTRSTLDSDKNR
jgi:polyhydroxyalkanoate synthesis repressor PhaR